MAWGKGLLVFALGWAIGKWILPSFYPFLFAFLFAAMIEPSVAFLERRGVSRGPGTLLALLAIAGFFGWVFFLVVGGLWSESVSLLRQMPAYYEEARKGLTAFGSVIGILGPGKLPTATGEGPLKTLFSFATGALAELARGAAKVPEAAVGLGVAVVAAYFLTKDRPKILLATGRVLPKGLVDWGQEVGGTFLATSMRYLKAQLILVMSTFTLTTVGLFLLGNRYALVLGLVTGVLDILPVLGPTTVLLPWGVYLLATGHGVQGVRLLILLLIVAGTRELIEMKVVGLQVGLHPVAALAAMYLGVQLFGVLGIALGPILIAAAWTAARTGTDRREVVR